MGSNPLADQEFTIAVGDAMKDIAEFLKAKNYNVFVTIVVLEMIKQNLVIQTAKVIQGRHLTR